VDQEIAAMRAGDLRSRLTVLRRKDGTTFPVLLIPQRLVADDGAFAGSFVVLVDLAAVQTAKDAGYGGAQDARSRLVRIGLELQCLSATLAVPGAHTLPLDHPDLTDLSGREREILAHLVAGDRVPAIARQLFISPHTVRSHLKSIFRKTGAESQSDLIQHVHSLRPDRPTSDRSS